LADDESYSIDQFLASAAAEKMAALRTLAYLRNEAAAGRREDFDRFLAAVPDAEPAETDRLPKSASSLRSSFPPRAHALRGTRTFPTFCVVQRISCSANVAPAMRVALNPKGSQPLAGGRAAHRRNQNQPNSSPINPT
jgi:hypothetical protein